MLLLKILGVLLILLTLLCMVRLQILLTAYGQTASVDLRAGWICFRVYPLRRRPKKKKPEKPEKKEEKPEEGLGRRFSVTRADVWDALRTLPGPVRRSLRRIARDIRVHPLTVEWVVGGQREPADAANRYGYLCAALWTFMPMIEKIVSIPEPSIYLDVDFNAPADSLRGEAGISARLGTLMAALMGTVIPSVLLLVRVLRRNRQKQTVANQSET